MGRNRKAAIAFFGRVMGREPAALRRPSVDPVRRSLETAPVDDEPLSPEDIEAIEEAKAETGPFYSLADLRASLARRRQA